MGPNWDGDFSQPKWKCSHGTYNPSGKEINPMCSSCTTPVASAGLTKRKAREIALKTVGVRIRRVLKDERGM